MRPESVGPDAPGLVPDTAAVRLPEPTADPQWRDARIVGHVRMFNDELRWIVECPDGTQHRVVAVAVQEDWQTPVAHGVGVNDAT